MRAPARPPAGWHARAGHTVMGQVDQRLAAVAHLSIGFGVVVGVGFLLGLAINLVIWLRSKRSSVVEYHAEQAGAYQLAVLLINLGLAALWIGIAGTAIGGWNWHLGSWPVWQPLAGLLCLLTPAIVVWYVGTIVYGLYGGLLVAAGREFSYPVFGPWARRRLDRHRTG
jgi:hypothetical protein